MEGAIVDSLHNVGEIGGGDGVRICEQNSKRAFLGEIRGCRTESRLKRSMKRVDTLRNEVALLTVEATVEVLKFVTVIFRRHFSFPKDPFSNLRSST